MKQYALSIIAITSSFHRYIHFFAHALSASNANMICYIISSVLRFPKTFLVNCCNFFQKYLKCFISVLIVTWNKTTYECVGSYSVQEREGIFLIYPVPYKVIIYPFFCCSCTYLKTNEQINKSNQQTF